MFNYVRIKHFSQLKGYLCSMVTKILFIICHYLCSHIISMMSLSKEATLLN